MTTFEDSVRATIAETVFNHAVNPSLSTYLSLRFGGDGALVTKEDVAAKFGEAAAQAWQDARDAKARYFAAIREGGE